MKTPFSFFSRLKRKPIRNGGRVALVTGGSSGIGRTIVDTLLNEGWMVVVFDLEEPESPIGQNGLVILGDVGIESDVKGAIQDAVDTFGGLDALVNNAGIGINRPLEKLTLNEWNSVIGTNLTGPFLCSKHAAPQLRKRNGAIVNIASTRAIQSEAHTEAYSASKGGIVALTHAMAVSLGPDIRVNCISPGWIETDPEAVHSESDEAQHPCGRIGTPGDIAAMAAYLLSDRAGFITGQDFVIDGGMTKKMIYTD
jgi:NAD(P)-dependent dehydrogenase (short-subunit alcohol dehydrogenase family)